MPRDAGDDWPAEATELHRQWWEVLCGRQAEIDEEAWATLHSPVSRPFDKPQTGRIAVKVINHYGDEVLKVYEVA